MANVSLSREILYGSDEAAVKLIRGGADVNEKDAWGLTPLIEATLKNKVEIAKLLLSHGADVDQRDISGQTALQWAVNRHNSELIKLYLEAGANPNHYSKDGQPVLVNPILRGERELIQSLVAHGADLVFPKDYITAKLMGHRFELVGKADIINTQGKFIELDYEGFYLEFTVGLILRTLINFFNSAEGKRYSSYNMVLQKVIRTLKDAVELIQYKYSTEGLKENEENIRALLNKDTIVVPVAFEGHAITFVKYGNIFSKCDRGVKRIVDTVVVNQVGNPYALNPDFLKDLLYTNKSDEYINDEIKKILRLTPFATLPPRYQLSGNCSWANVEAAIPAMMFMLMFRGDLNARGEIAALKQSVMDYYDTWVEWDKDRVLDECIEEFYLVDRPRQAAKAGILAAILLQRCRPNEPREVKRAKKILPILTIPDYNYILRGYVNVYCTKAAGKVGEDFTQLLKMCGLNLKTLTLN